MKKLFNIKIAFVSLMSIALFSSCLKDPTREYHLADNAPVADFPLVAFGSALNTATLSAAAATNTINAEITIGAPHDYTTASTVTVIVDAAAMNATYNSVTPTYTLLPPSTYTVSTLTPSIIPGIQQRIAPTLPIVGAPVALPVSLGSVSFVVNTAALQALRTANPTVTYMLPLTISSVSGNNVVIDQYHTLYYKIAVGP